MYVIKVVERVYRVYTLRRGWEAIYNVYRSEVRYLFDSMYHEYRYQTSDDHYIGIFTIFYNRVRWVQGIIRTRIPIINRETFKSIGRSIKQNDRAGLGSIVIPIYKYPMVYRRKLCMYNLLYRK